MYLITAGVVLSSVGGDGERTDSPARGGGDQSTATSASQDEEFVDAVDDLPKDSEFQPANPDSELLTGDAFPDRLK